MKRILDYFEEEIESVTEANFFCDLDESPEFKEKPGPVELINIVKFPLCVEDDGVLTTFERWPEMFRYIKEYESELPERYLFADEYDDGGTHYRPVFTFCVCQDFGADPEARPSVWVEININMIKVQ
jgi:hypothetical protein